MNGGLNRSSARGGVALKNLVSMSTPVAIFLLSNLVLFVGWYAGAEPVTRLHSGFAAMVPSTAICFLILSLVLIVDKVLGGNDGWSQSLVSLGGAIVYAVAFINLVVVVAGLASGVDGLLFAGFDEMTRASMAPATSVCFICASLALMTLNLPGRVARFVLAASLGVGALVSAVAIAGYGYTGVGLHDVGLFSSMALHTAVLFLALFGSMVLLRKVPAEPVAS